MMEDPIQHWRNTDEGENVKLYGFKSWSSLEEERQLKKVKMFSGYHKSVTLKIKQQDAEDKNWNKKCCHFLAKIFWWLNFISLVSYQSPSLPLPQVIDDNLENDNYDGGGDDNGSGNDDDGGGRMMMVTKEWF